ncbi:carbohydrate-binding module family 50 protein [Parathielavia appendiculata]|uniref:Carbohydrate-binding module family 50 protein n=1 Tax=Parathielavia appendiculata TaxID=2587402 RepID=A0AAN6TNW2_9PEZI|nr:carbohydrate-binding module family 50 protein [Parathielavia appendiculata]
MLHTYKWACLTDTTTGARCLSLLVQQASAENGMSPSDLCSACSLRLSQAVLDSPLGYTDALAADYSSLTSSCQVTSYPVTSPTRYALGTTTAPIPTPADGVPVPSYTCESRYTIQESDTCESISRAKQVSTFSLLYSNKLPMFCLDFPAVGTEICIPQRCNTYMVLPIDTCQSVAEKHGLTAAKLIELNPNLKSQCDNLRALTGHAICLSPPGVVSTTATPQPTTAS